MRIAVIGGGYVGLVSGACLADKGHDVQIVERNAAKVAQINSGISPIHEADLDDILQNCLSQNRLRATEQLADAVASSDVTLIAVGTPFKGDQIDLSQIESASAEIGKALKKASQYHVVIVKSTVVPGTTDNVVLPLLQQHSGKKAGTDFGVGMNPEFLREGAAVSDFMNPDRIVLGGIDEHTQKTMQTLYDAFPDTDKVLVNNRTAEMIKYASNSLLATLISFSNEMGNLCDAIDNVDVKDVLAGVQLDKRFSPILPSGERISPVMNTYLEAGCGFGGSCFPKDVNALRAYGKQHQVHMPVLDAVMQTNAEQPKQMLLKLQAHVPQVNNKRITILGLAFKPGTDDIRESPAIPLIKALQELGANVTAFDPIAMHTTRLELGDDSTMTYADSLESAIEGADAILLITSWPEFSGLPKLLATAKKQPLVVDGRRFYAANSIRRYEGIGRNNKLNSHSQASDTEDSEPSGKQSKDGGVASAA